MPIPDAIDPQSGQPVRLLACPFCGSPAKLEIGETPNFSSNPSAKVSLHFHIECDSPPAIRCSMGKHWLTSSAEKAAEAWNRRTPPAA